jgi:hypothetical protein
VALMELGGYGFGGEGEGEDPCNRLRRVAAAMQASKVGMHVASNFISSLLHMLGHILQMVLRD